MKLIKRVLVAACAACLAIAFGAMLVACEPALEPEPFYGHWTLLSHDDGNGNVYTADALNGMGISSDDLMSFDLAEDGSATLKSGGANPAAEEERVSWETTPDGVRIKSSDSQIELTYNADAKQLVLPVGQQGSATFYRP